jgi:hypothetical protein
MPNHVTSYIQGPDIDKVIGCICINGDVDFNLIIPMPEGMSDVTSGGSLNSFQTFLGLKKPHFEADWAQAVKDASPEDFVNFGKAYRLFKDTGFWSWYDWSCENWGTKWNAYDVDICPGEQLIFNTAWAPPEPVFEAIAKRGHRFTVQWSDEGGPEGVLRYGA